VRVGKSASSVLSSLWRHPFQEMNKVRPCFSPDFRGCARGQGGETRVSKGAARDA
jgi:hypothetical protein